MRHGPKYDLGALCVLRSLLRVGAGRLCHGTLSDDDLTNLDTPCRGLSGSVGLAPDFLFVPPTTPVCGCLVEDPGVPPSSVKVSSSSPTPVKFGERRRGAGGNGVAPGVDPDLESASLVIVRDPPCKIW